MASLFRLVILFGCTFVPFKPFIPLGCSDLVPVCICSNAGMCSWVWQCVQE